MGRSSSHKLIYAYKTTRSERSCAPFGPYRAPITSQGPKLWGVRGGSYVIVRNKNMLCMIFSHYFDMHNFSGISSSSEWAP